MISGRGLATGECLKSHSVLDIVVLLPDQLQDASGHVRRDTLLRQCGHEHLSLVPYQQHELVRCPPVHLGDDFLEDFHRGHGYFVGTGDLPVSKGRGVFDESNGGGFQWSGPGFVSHDEFRFFFPELPSP